MLIFTQLYYVYNSVYTYRLLYFKVQGHSALPGAEQCLHKDCLMPHLSARLIYLKIHPAVLIMSYIFEWINTCTYVYGSFLSQKNGGLIHRLRIGTLSCARAALQ